MPSERTHRSASQHIVDGAYEGASVTTSIDRTDRAGARRPRGAGEQPPWRCSTAARPCRSSPAIARKRPARSTTRNCARSKSGCAICASWRSGAPSSSIRSASRASSTTRSKPRSAPPTARGGSRTSICRSSRSAAPRPRSPRRPASSRSPICCWRTPENDPPVAAARFVDAEKQVADVAAALDGARAILVERFAEDADLIGSLREEMWSAGRLASKVRDGQAGSRRQVQRLFRFRREAREGAVASHPGAVPRREGRDSRCRHRAGKSGDGRPPAPAPTSCGSCAASASAIAGAPATNG